MGAFLEYRHRLLVCGTKPYSPPLRSRDFLRGSCQARLVATRDYLLAALSMPPRKDGTIFPGGALIHAHRPIDYGSGNLRSAAKAAERAHRTPAYPDLSR